MSEGITIYLWNLHATHIGLTEAQSGALCEAASVCLSRHHLSPVLATVIVNSDAREHLVEWVLPTQRIINANHNELDATCHGACAITLACLEARLELVAIGRGDHGSGSDYYVAPPGRGMDADGKMDLDDPAVKRLEVGGTDHQPLQAVVHKKREQVRAGDSFLNPIIGVVAFHPAIVHIEDVEV